MLRTFDKVDARFIFVVVLGFTVFFVFGINFASYPAEDAAMLMRYAKHLVEGHGYAWNPGEAPLDGATDFLPVLLIALIMKLGASLETATRLLGLVCHLLTIILVYVGARRWWRASRELALVTAAFAAFGPAIAYIQAYFTTTCFALSVAAAWYVASKAIDHPPSKATSFTFAVACLTMGLIRPEGVFLAGFMLISIMMARGVRECRDLGLLTNFLLFFVLPGAVFFAGRWMYFDHPFPNPFYVKRAGTLQWGGLKVACLDLVQLTAPFLLAFIFVLRTPGRLKEAHIALTPVLGFTAIWIILSDPMNFQMRYHYPVVPILLMTWPKFVETGVWNAWSTNSTLRRAILCAPPVALAMMILLWQIQQFRNTGFIRDGRYDAALALAGFKDKNYTLAVSEAGLLPLYSQWRSIDTWGLNDRWIAHNGGITQGYLEEQKPDVIMFHAHFSPLREPQPKDRWDQMTMVLRAYAEKEGFTLAAAWGVSVHDNHYYFVRRSCPDSQALIRKIRNLDYYWYRTNQQAYNFAGS